MSCNTYGEANNKYMNSIESSYLKYLDTNNLFGWAMSQEFPANDFKLEKKMLSKFDECYKKDYDKNNNQRYFLEVDVEYQKKLFNPHTDLSFLPERNKIKKCNKPACNIYDRENYVVHTRALKQALNHGLILKKVHRIIQFNQEAWLQPYIDMNTKLKTEATNGFEKVFLKLMNIAVFGKTMKNVRM